MTIQTANSKITELYKHQVIAGSAPRFESINGTPDLFTLQFLAMPNRSSMDASSFALIIKELEQIFAVKYKVVAFNIGRNSCSIVVKSK